MINSISNNQEYQYQTNQTRNGSGKALTEFAKLSTSTSQEDSSGVANAASSTEYSMEEYMEMMRNGKVPPVLETSTETTSAAGDISAIDADGDGTISSDEYSEMISQMGIQDALSAEDFFTQYDANGDGEISIDEMPEPGTVAAGGVGAPPPKPEELDDETIAEYDTDGDGVLSAAEYAAMMEALRGNSTEENSEDIDADSDGTISADEYATMISEMGIPDALTADEFFSLYDTNEDGEITAEEMPEPGTVGASTTTDATAATEATTETETLEELLESIAEQSAEGINLSASYQNMIMQALRAYENNYESMFESTDGTLLSNQA